MATHKIAPLVMGKGNETKRQETRERAETQAGDKRISKKRGREPSDPKGELEN